LSKPNNVATLLHGCHITVSALMTTELYSCILLTYITLSTKWDFRFRSAYLQCEEIFSWISFTR